MKYVNDTGRPELDVIAKAVNLWAGKYDSGGADATATELISPPQLAALKRKWGDKLTMPITSSWWAMFGSILHQLLSEVEDDNFFEEWRLFG